MVIHTSLGDDYNFAVRIFLMIIRDAFCWDRISYKFSLDTSLSDGSKGESNHKL